MQKRIICVSVINEHSVLARISGLFAGRGYNIDSLTVAPLPNSNLSYITISTRGDEKVLEQIIKQLHKLIPVLNVIESSEIVTQEIVLLKFENNEKIGNISALIAAAGGKIVSFGEKNIIFSVSGESARIKDLIKSLVNFAPKEIVRSGVVAMER
ncbi:acetolactate synthase small subunit [Helicobacter saguini]|uniref:Acetolactate synthase small subunit n=1 Tax=Helicobacter saguini TaxID=1548018 RepID=A0A347VPX8_9HELI|nr:acetolactate synthase small subunit [Helicobacter saguini]MWV61167.1 acetolactate synthase small subunit [Helicobacter saguini]MWV68166.1 acetolactate synthase small subunit [Helicobacter saguini]MWV70371.1 acetolactate synthase small subunit [Helicobacter saguini]MWV72272.1 acetolactate synthase small subunit [Helicobacter saguini]TLD95314.1 acetolactate synthase small subunit [Helicobacter saguini]